MRFFARAKLDLPVNLNGRFSGSGATFTDVSLNGAFIRGQFPSLRVGDSPFLKYDLPGYGSFDHSGKTVRKDTDGVAVVFYGLDSASKVKLWSYLSDRLKDLEECPYCGHAESPLPSECTRCGWNLDFHSPAYLEYHEKTYLLKKLHSHVERLTAGQIRQVIDLLETDLMKKSSCDDFREFVGTSQAIKEVYAKVRKVAPTDVPVLILGESGTGKELTALAIHQRSARKEKGFVPINCAAIPENLLESELFGYEKGSYTGAYSRKIGKFECADGGTLFLDEIAELSPALQAKLLRFLENQVIERIGAVNGKKIDVRFIAATNMDLQAAMTRGQFRPDLYYRLDAFTIKLPPLKDRGEDKLLLAQYFLKKACLETGLLRDFSEEALRAMGQYDWPGNVREINNKIRKAVVLANHHSIQPKDLDLPTPDASGERTRLSGDGNGRKVIEKQRVIDTLELCRYNISKTAKILGVSRPTVYSFKRRYGI